MSRRTTLAVSSALALLSVPAVAVAVSGDGNDDALPDRWERRHGLSLKVDQSGRDQDRDGLRNRAEFRHRTHPRRADTDRDGVRDGREVRLGHDPLRHDDHLNAGTVGAYADGVLTVALARGGTVRARVTGATEVKCAIATARAARRGDDDDRGDDSRGRGRGSDDAAGDDGGRRGRGSDDGAGHVSGRGRDTVECGPSALTRGKVVREAELVPGSGGTIWREVELLG